MRPHSQVAVQKLWGVINAPLEAGAELQVEVTNRYNTYAFNGAKTGAGRGLAPASAAGLTWLLLSKWPEAQRRTAQQAQQLSHALLPLPCASAAHALPAPRSPPPPPLLHLLPSAPAVIVTTNSWVGGRNVFLGACYLAVGGLCLLTALAFFLGYDLSEWRAGACCWGGRGLQPRCSR